MHLRLTLCPEVWSADFWEFRFERGLRASAQEPPEVAVNPASLSLPRSFIGAPSLQYRVSCCDCWLP